MDTFEASAYQNDLALSLRIATAAAAELMGVTYAVAATMPVAAIEWRLNGASRQDTAPSGASTGDDPGAFEMASPTLGIVPLGSGQYRTESYDPLLRYDIISDGYEGDTELLPKVEYPRVVILAPSDLEGATGDQIGIDGGTTPELLFVQLDNEPKGMGHWFRADDTAPLS